MPESKTDRFKRLAEKRVTRTIRDLRLIGNLANRNNYDYTEEHVTKILAALKREVQALRARFENQETDDEHVFRL